VRTAHSVAERIWSDRLVLVLATDIPLDTGLISRKEISSRAPGAENSLVSFADRVPRPHSCEVSREASRALADWIRVLDTLGEVAVRRKSLVAALAPEGWQATDTVTYCAIHWRAVRAVAYIGAGVLGSVVSVETDTLRERAIPKRATRRLASAWFTPTRSRSARHRVVSN
jgi:hypothetical protein